jgi:hypothetical protein
MRRSVLLWGLCLAAIRAGQAPLAAQDIQPAVHRVFQGQAACDEPQRIVVKLPPPQVEVRDRCSSSGGDAHKKCCLFQRRCAEAPRGVAPIAEVLWAPVSLPAMIVQPAVQSSLTTTQQFTYDFSALQHAHELEMRTAALAAQTAARNAMVNAENEALQHIVDRAQKKLAALAPAAASGLAGDKSDGRQVSLETALKNLDTRLNRLEELVLLHQQALNDLKTKKNP